MVWRVGPLHRLIYSIIREEKSIDYDRLLNKVRFYSKDISEDNVRNALIKLEIWDKIDVVSINEKHIKIVLKQRGESQ